MFLNWALQCVLSVSLMSLDEVSWPCLCACIIIYTKLICGWVCVLLRPTALDWREKKRGRGVKGGIKPLPSTEFELIRLFFVQLILYFALFCFFYYMKTVKILRLVITKCSSKPLALVCSSIFFFFCPHSLRRRWRSSSQRILITPRGSQVNANISGGLAFKFRMRLLNLACVDCLSSPMTGWEQRQGESTSWVWLNQTAVT